MEDRRRLVDLLDLAVAHDGDAIADRQSFRLVMSNEHGRCVGCSERSYDVTS